MYASTRIDELERKQIRSLAKKALQYCECQLGKRSRRPIPKLVLNWKNPEKDWGEYYDHSNEIHIYPHRMKKLGQVASTVIHEYTHYLQPRGNVYENLLRRWGYADHPHEIEARLNDIYWTRKFFHWLRSGAKR